MMSPTNPGVSTGRGAWGQRETLNPKPPTISMCSVCETGFLANQKEMDFHFRTPEVLIAARFVGRNERFFSL